MATETFKCCKNSTLFDAQNAAKTHFRACRFQIFLGGMPPDPVRGREPYGPLSGHSRLLHPQWPLITNVNEIPGLFACC